MLGFPQEQEKQAACFFVRGLEVVSGASLAIVAKQEKLKKPKFVIANADLKELLAGLPCKICRK